MKFLAIFLSGLCLSSIGFAGSPPPNVPKELYEEFTLGGKIPVLNWYLYEPGSQDQPTLFTKIPVMPLASAMGI